MIEHTPRIYIGPVIAATVLAALLLLVLLAAGALVPAGSRTVFSSPGTSREASRTFAGQPRQPTPAAATRPAPMPAVSVYLVDSPSQATLTVEQLEAANLFRLQLGSPPIPDTAVVVVRSSEEAEGISITSAAASPAVAVVDLRER